MTALVLTENDTLS